MSLNFRDVDGVKIQSKHKASCCCGSVEVELDLPEGFVDLRCCGLWQSYSL
ncbi:hypothetical protein [Teredinibacter sp. KSP-S5-2]|uniref:hypothetical protein n=1 Tax=Teredinibacter sp. KSP-S5-2 TaxID=3034506 RepID=UPI00293431F6|nr:hypothetical protein [Teredinibacter sp. KSP-S5-2]WNO11654.1 hypothetical protein P5V12_10770 [Teredinibacter sp. KSP-S5-2]